MKRAPIPPAAGAQCAPYINLELSRQSAAGREGDVPDAVGAAYAGIDIPAGAGEPINPQEEEALLLDHVTGADEWPPMVFSA